MVIVVNITPSNNNRGNQHDDAKCEIQQQESLHDQVYILVVLLPFASLLVGQICSVIGPPDLGQD